MRLKHNTYGKANVQVLKVFRDGDRHLVREIAVSVRVEGELDGNYTDADNRSCVPTDTIKNTVFVLAKSHFTESLAAFAVTVSSHFLRRYDHLRRVTVRVEESPWNRMRVDGEEHDHSFLRSECGREFARTDASDEGMGVWCGVRGLTVLKSTGSGFENFHKCELTTLQPTNDRILATTMEGEWRFASREVNFDEQNRRVMDSLLRRFAGEYSPSVQRTLFRMGEAALESAGDVDEITLKMPNEHYFLFDLAAFDLENDNEIFYPSKAPFGDIEATVSRT